ncbi:MAG: hypothetical protein HKO05_10640 [Erythrobacter sp.]|nr:hypothetical protein [Erythrobacter sp.]
MDTLRGQFGSFDDDARDDDFGEDDIAREAPPSPVGQDERRMQVRAYNHWASLLQDRNFPAIEDLDFEALPDFGPHSVLLDFTSGVENPAIQYLGAELAIECGSDGPVRALDDVPSRSLLSRITDHYMQILANQAPIGFEAEFVNQNGATTLYRGILLPFSSDDDTIDFIYGVINWKEVADQLTTDELLLEVDQALDDSADELEIANHSAEPVTDWADGPASSEGSEVAGSEAEPVTQEDVPEPGYAVSDEPADADLSGDDDWGIEQDDFDDDDDDADEGEVDLTPFALPDIGDADEEDTIDHSAFASLAPTGDVEDEEEGDQPASGLMGLRNKPAKKPLDLSLASALEPMTDGIDQDGDADNVDELGADDGQDAEGESFDAQDPPVGDFSRLMGSDLPADDGDEDPDDWSAPIDAEAAQLAGPDATPDEGSGEAKITPSDHIPAFDDGESPEKPDGGAGDASGLYDTLAEARELAQVAQSKEERSRTALYDAVGRAYDVSLAAQEAPEDFEELIAENGLTAQDRAPMTPVVKLVFGADYDKTRLTEYAAVLSHAHRLGLARGALSRFLSASEGGLKGVVQAERRIRREEEGKQVDPVDAVRPALAKKLRQLDIHGFEDLASDGPEFAVVMIRRMENGEIAMIGEVGDDIPLVEKVARKLVG